MNEQPSCEVVTASLNVFTAEADVFKGQGFGMTGANELNYSGHVFHSS